MSADLLREAAAKMRERAEATVTVYSATGEEVPWHSAEGLKLDWDPEDAEHIAGMSPAVALAVADWLEWVAEPVDECILPFDAPLYVRAIAVAHAYLGSPS